MHQLALQTLAANDSCQTLNRILKLQIKMTPGAAEEHASVNQNAIWRVINVYREKEDVDRPQPEGLQ